LQVQFKKADLIVEGIKDLIITNGNIQNYRIENVEGRHLLKGA